MSHVTAIGCGNIGSYLAPHLGRLHGVESVSLIDPDIYESKNLNCQSILPADVGKAKAKIQAKLLRRINPGISVRGDVSSVENLPMGALRSNLILTCLDSRLARQYVNQAVWRLGIPWIDAGVEPKKMLVRVSAYRPGMDLPCLECAWSDRDYQALETTYSCSGAAKLSSSTNGSSGLGAFAASILVLEAEKYLAGQPDLVTFGKQILIDAAHHKQYLTSMGRNPQCRFDHKVWKIEKLNVQIRQQTLGDLLRLSGTGNSLGDSSWLTVGNHMFVKRLACSGCGHTKYLMRLQCSLRARDISCALCGCEMFPVGWDLAEKLTSHLPQKVLSRSLWSLGIRNGEILTIGDSSHERHFVITVTDCEEGVIRNE